MNKEKRDFIADPNKTTFQRYYSSLQRSGKLQFQLPNLPFKNEEYFEFTSLDFCIAGVDQVIKTPFDKPTVAKKVKRNRGRWLSENVLWFDKIWHWRKDLPGITFELRKLIRKHPFFLKYYKKHFDHDRFVAAMLIGKMGGVEQFGYKEIAKYCIENPI